MASGLVLALGALPVPAAENLATVPAGTIQRHEIAGTGGAPAETGRFHDQLWQRVARHYIEQNELDATAAEVDEVAAYHREFERRDRALSARKWEVHLASPIDIR